MGAGQPALAWVAPPGQGVNGPMPSGPNASNCWLVEIGARTSVPSSRTAPRNRPFIVRIRFTRAFVRIVLGTMAFELLPHTRLAARHERVARDLFQTKGVDDQLGIGDVFIRERTRERRLRRIDAQQVDGNGTRGLHQRRIHAAIELDAWNDRLRRAEP